MMRYQRVATQDSHPLTNGKISTSPAIEGSTNNTNRGLLRFRSPSHSPPQSDNHHHHEPSPRRHDDSPSPSRGGDGLLQWGQRKRARVSRSIADESSSSSALKLRQQPPSVNKKRTASLGGDKLSTTMPPPPPGRSSTLRNSLINKESSGFNHISMIRNLEEQAGAGNGSSPSRNTPSRAVSRSSKRSPTPEKVDKKFSCHGLVKVEKVDGSLAQADNNSTRVDSVSAQSEREAEVANVANVTGSCTRIEWPRIYLALSRKEKEEDFMALKGTKLPHRPKKRTKNVDRSLQYCFPGMWLQDLTKSRYEVREKKCVKKQQKRRGLKGMESMDSGSE